MNLSTIQPPMFTTNSTNTTSPHTCTMKTLEIFLLLGYSLVFIIGVGGNTLVLLLFMPNWKKGPIIELLILYLAFFDLLSSIFGPLVFVYWILTCGYTWHFGSFGCKLLPALSRIFTDISIGIILTMAIDRCRSIVTPFKRRFSRLTIHSSVLFTITVSTLCEMYYINALYMEKGYCTVMAVSEPIYSYPLVILTALRNLAFIVIFSVTTIAVYFQLRSSSEQKLLSASQSFQAKHSRRSRVMKMLVTMAIIFLLTVIPRDILHLAYTISWMDSDGISNTPLLNLTNSTFKLLQVSNSIYNVFIYGKMHDHFWNNLKVLMFCQEGERHHTYRTVVKRSNRRESSLSTSVTMCKRSESFRSAHSRESSRRGRLPSDSCRELPYESTALSCLLELKETPAQL